MMNRPSPWQESVWRTLVADLDRLPHALLFMGRRGTGKVDLATLLAQALLCESPMADHLPCGSCVACHWFTGGAHPDFRMVTPQTDDVAGVSRSAPIKIDQIREVGDFVSLTSHQKGRRILLVHPAENMNPNAANALLKTLEEPPPATVILLVAHRPGLLPATILSRCHKVRMPDPLPEQAIAWLESQGVVGAEALMAFAGNAPYVALQEAAQPDLIERRRELLELLFNPAKLDVLALAARIEKLDRAMVVEWCVKAVHDLLSGRLAGQVRFYPEWRERIGQIAGTVSLEALLDLQKLLNECAATANHPLNAQLYYERLLLGWQRAVSATRETA